MAQFGPPQLLADYGDFGRPQALREALLPSCGPRVFLSPDGRHLLVWVTRQRRLLSFLRLPGAPSPPPQPGDYLEHNWPAQAPPLCGLLFLQSPGQAWLMALVWEGGRAEVWGPPRGPSSKSWLLLQSLELCHGPRARVVSICCMAGQELLWCEERSTSSLSTYCVCRRSLTISGQRVALNSVRIVLHHSPFYIMASSSTHVFMVPNTGHHPILVYSPPDETVALSTVTTGIIHSKALAESEADYKKLVLEYIGFTARRTPPDVQYFVVTGAGHLLLMTVPGQIYLLHKDSTVRHIFDTEIKSPIDGQVKMEIFGDILACAVGTLLYLIDTPTGRLLAKQPLNAEEVFFLRVLETEDIQMLTKTGIYKLGSAVSGEEEGTSASALMEMVYEEACKYYQRRSLSNTKLTVQTLKKEGMFQAPITLSAILNSYQKKGKPKGTNKYTDLMNNLSNELQSFVSLELLKSGIVNAPAAEMAKYCDELIDLEITRLLQLDLDRENLVYINCLFCTFPSSAWMSLRNNFQFQQNGDGKLVILATADLWKKVLNPLPLGSRENSQNGVYPLFEIICQSLCTYKPKWLPGFVQHAQDYSGLHWNFATKENCEGVPLYKRALSVLNKRKENTNVDLEVEILLCSGRPQAIIQAIHTLIRLQRWSRVIEETQRYSQHNPMIKKDIFITLLVEFVKHRNLDPYVSQLCDICPDDTTATDVLRIVLQNIPKMATDPPPFPCDGREHLTVGLLKPLLNKVLQNQVRREESFASPTYPPTTPLRLNRPDTQHPVVNGDDLSPNDIYGTNAL